MVITEISPTEVLDHSRQTMGLATASDAPIDEAFLAALIRRGAGNACPCSRATLRSIVGEGLRYLTENDSSLSERIEDVIEGLIIGGDLLELSDVATDDSSVRGTWVFAAPPSFVVRPGGSVFLCGIVPDQDTFLPQFLASRVVSNRFTRMVLPEAGEDLPSRLREVGLQELSDSVWLKSPKPEGPESLLDRMKRRLEAEPPSGSVESLQILDATQHVTYYRGRWSEPKNHSGTFVARRQQEFGAPIWCFAALEGGTVVRFLDLPLKKSRWRGCDAAWHLQMAIDHCRLSPQRYRHRREGSHVRFDFFSPLPQWSERRLMIFGSPVPPDKCLLTYRLPVDEAGVEENFIQKNLWLSRTVDSD